MTDPRDEVLRLARTAACGFLTFLTAVGVLPFVNHWAVELVGVIGGITWIVFGSRYRRAIAAIGGEKP